MRVLHTFKLYRPAQGGVISVMRDLVESAPADVQSRVLTCRTEGPSQASVGRAEVRRSFAPLEVMSLPLAPAYPFRQFAMSRDSDIIASHSPFPLAELTVAIAGRWMPPCVVHWHSEVIAQKKVARILGPITRRYLDRAAAVLVSTPGHIEISPWLREYRDKCHVIPFGIDAGQTVAPTRPGALPEAWPEKFGLFLGRLVPYKGLDVLLEAAANAPLPIVIAGGGPMAGMLQQQITRRGLEGKLLLTGEISEAEKAWLLGHARFMVLPSTGENETFGVVQLEAMAAGLPIINTNAHPGIGWVARDGKEALTVPHGDAMQLSNAMQRLAQDDAMASEFGHAARERVVKDFAYDRFVRDVFSIYRSVMAGA